MPNNDRVPNMKQAMSFTARAVSVPCPYCGQENPDLLGDPRGKEGECGSCGKTFGISEDAEPVIEA